MFNVFDITRDCFSSSSKSSSSHSTLKDLRVEALESTTSTNTIAKENAFNETSNTTLYLAKTQTEGRGRNQNTWSEGNPGDSLFMTLSLKVEKTPQHLTGPLMGLSLFKSVSQCWPQLEWSLKAPNDLYLQDKKVAGLLLETVSQSSSYRLLIGLGINVFSHPQDIEVATHLCSAKGLADSVNTEDWTAFMNTLCQNLSTTALSSHRTQLEEQELTDLLLALNANPLKDETIVEITPSGDLVTASEGSTCEGSKSKTISWKDL